MADPSIVAAAPQHLAAVAEIYTRTAASSPATFDLDGKPLAFWERSLAHCDAVAGHLLVVALEG